MRFCFQGNFTGALLGKTAGGGELQVALLAKSLALHGHEVIIIDPYDCDEDFISSEGIKVLTVPNWKKGIPMLRYAFRLLPKYYRLLLKQKADVYYCRMRDFRHLLVYIVSRKVKARFILAMAADIDATGFKERYRYFYKKQGISAWTIFNGIMVEIVQPFLLRKADIILTQHEGQSHILSKKHIHSFVFKNLIDISNFPKVGNPTRTDFIYVSTWLNKRKGFIQLSQLIEQSPGQTFSIVGKPSDSLSNEHYLKLKKLENVTLLGQVDHMDSLIHIANSRALVTTSPMEGFPNIFLEAWATGVPVISWIVDPGDIVVKNHLGLVCNGKFDLLCSYVNNFDVTQFDPVALKKYVEENHSNEHAHSKLLTILNS